MEFDNDVNTLKGNFIWTDCEKWFKIPIDLKLCVDLQKEFGMDKVKTFKVGAV